MVHRGSSYIYNRRENKLSESSLERVYGLAGFHVKDDFSIKDVDYKTVITYAIPISKNFGYFKFANSIDEIGIVGIDIDMEKVKKWLKSCGYDVDKLEEDTCLVSGEITTSSGTKNRLFETCALNTEELLKIKEINDEYFSKFPKYKINITFDTHSSMETFEINGANLVTDTELRKLFNEYVNILYKKGVVVETEKSPKFDNNISTTTFELRRGKKFFDDTAYNVKELVTRAVLMPLFPIVMGPEIINDAKVGREKMKKLALDSVYKDDQELLKTAFSVGYDKKTADKFIKLVHAFKDKIERDNKKEAERENKERELRDKLNGVP